MSVFTYKADIYSESTLYQSLLHEGVDMTTTIIKCIPEYLGGDPTGSTDITIETDGVQAQCDSAVSKSLSGTLEANKQAKKESVSIKSTELIKSGLSHTTATGITGLFPIENVKEELSFYNTVVDALKENPSEAPQIIPTADDNGVPIMNTAEAISLNDDVRHRMEYIYSSLTANPDASKSQLLLDSEIDQAINQAELDSIVDTRV